MGIQRLVSFLLVAHTRISPESPVEVAPYLPDARWSHPVPCLLYVIEIPNEEMGECGAHAEISSKQLDDPCARVKWLRNYQYGTLHVRWLMEWNLPILARQAILGLPQSCRSRWAVDRIPCRWGRITLEKANIQMRTTKVMMPIKCTYERETFRWPYVLIVDPNEHDPVKIK